MISTLKYLKTPFVVPLVTMLKKVPIQYNYCQKIIEKCLVSKLIDILCTYLANRGVDIVTHKVPSYHKKKKITNYLRMCSLIYNFSTIEKSCPMKGT